MNDEPGGLIQTGDGGYIMAGQTHSDDGDVTSNHGKYDLWIVKMDGEGKIQWQKTYGGSQDDYGGAILPALDGGYIIAASTNSIDGDLKGLRTDTAQSDIWVLKIDSLGNIDWQKIYGGSKFDAASSIVFGGEGEYVISGITESGDGDVKGFHGGSGADIWVFQISETGVLGWQKTLGGSKDDEGGIVQIPGGFAVIGTTYSTDGDVTGRVRDSSADVWLVKLSNSGDIIWQKTYGGSGYDAGNDVIPTLDHGYAIAGLTFTNDDGDVSGIHQPAYYSDCWIVKLDGDGNIQWQQCLGGSKGDAAYSILQTSDSGYIVSGSTSSNDGDVTGFHGISDCWIFKLSKSGKRIWEETLGGSASDANIGSGIMQTADNGFLVATVTSSNDGDVSSHHGDSLNSDIWLVKLSEDPSGVKNIFDQNNRSISVYPNPSLGKTTISYDLEKPSFVKIEIYSPLGDQLRTFTYGLEEIGNHDHEFDISSLNSGSYFFRIYFGNTSVIKGVVLMK